MNAPRPDPPDRARLLLVDDHTIVREGLRRILDGSGDGWTIAEAGSGFQALEILRQHAFALAIVGAEYVLRWLPRGTHQWSKFVRPSELAAALRPTGVRLRELAGVAYNPLSDSWRIGRDLSVNYMGFATR